MRPIKISMTAFGPYAGTEVLDMQSLGREGMYLITGDTGAGKTTIFDAVTYALFGRASGERRSPDMLRSKYASSDIRSEVELVFEYSGKLYTVRRSISYIRPSKRGNGTVTEEAEATLTYPDGRELSGLSKVTAASEEILGINYNQFCRIAMIAQGDFMKLLTAGTDERQEIFRKIFKTDIYRKLQDALKSEVGKISDELKFYRAKADRSLSLVKCAPQAEYLEQKCKAAADGQLTTAETMALISTIIDMDSAQKEADEALLSETERMLYDCQEKISEAQRLSELKLSLQKDEEKLSLDIKKLRDLEADAQNIPKRRAELEALMAKISVAEDKLSRYEELDKVTVSLEDARINEEKIRRRSADCSEKLEKCLQEIQAFRQELSNIGNPAEIRQKLALELSEVETAASAIDDALNVMKRKAELFKRYSELRISDACIKKETAKALESYNRAHMCFLDEQAGYIAEKLMDNMPCPVCGSTTHPHKANLSRGAISRNELERIKEEYDILKEKSEKSLAKLSELSGSCDAASREFEQLCAKVLGDYDKNNAEYELTTKSIEISEAKKLISDELVKVKEQEEAKANLETKLDNLTQAESQLNKLGTELSKALSAWEERAKAYEEMLIKLADGLEFKSGAEALENVNVLRSSRDILKQEILENERLYDELKNSVAVTSGSVSAKKEQLTELSDIDAGEWQAKYAKALEQKNLLTQSIAKLDSRIQINTGVQASVEADQTKLAELEKNYSKLRRLSNTANGNLSGKEKIMLETYVQMSYFDRIIYRANRRLAVMTEGQYELRRAESSGGYKSQTGLELDVIDYYNGTHRSVKSLSGGESFMASLSLALGLSDELQAANGGIELDCMFVDEGFGSLDSRSLSQAMKALLSLGESNRIVGIISHVSELKEKIDKQIVVTKDKSGGSRVCINL